jgi:hypothetical protein
LEKIAEGFGKSQRELCDYMAILRNQHIHSSELPYDNLKLSKWLPRFYEVVKILNDLLGKTLQDFLGPEIAVSAAEHIKTLNEEIKGAVKTKIAAHSKAFANKTRPEQKKLQAEAVIAVKRLPTGSVASECPSCGGLGVLAGDLIRELEPVYREGELLVDQIYLATEFKCLSCDLRLKGLREITYGEMDTQFTETTSTSLHELYEPEYEQEYDNM